MSTKKPRTAKTDHESRAKMGLIVKSLREAAGLTQVELARLVNQNYFTFISQVECGHVRIPPAETELWARILGADTQAFAKECVKAYEDQAYYRAIYGKRLES